MKKIITNFIKTILISSFFLLTFYQGSFPAYSATNNELTGTILEDTILTKEKSPYIVNSSITVPEGISLTINDGVILNFAPNTSINIEGNLFVNGTNNSHVIFQSQQDEKWDKLLLNSNNNIIKYLDIDDAKDGIVITKDENTIYNINMTNCNYKLNFYDNEYNNNSILQAVTNSISDYDVNKDNKIDILDVTSLAVLYNKKLGETGYESNKDLNKDNVINLYDLVRVSSQIGAEDNKLYGYKVFIDPGHGGQDPGAVQNGYLEKNINLSLALKLKNELMKYGADVVMSRESDVTLSLEQRVAMANQANADLLISIHHNSSTSSAPVGMSTHYSSYRPAIETKDAYAIYNGYKYPYISEQNGTITINYNGTPKTYSINDLTVYDPTPCNEAALSKSFSQSMVDKLSSLGFENDGIKDHNLYMTRWPKMASVLIEAGYISNSAEANKVTSPDMEQKMAEQITKAVLEK